MIFTQPAAAGRARCGIGAQYGARPAIPHRWSHADHAGRTIHRARPGSAARGAEPIAHRERCSTAEEDVVAQQLHLLLTAYGDNPYNSVNRARADDLLVRQRASGALGGAATHLGRLATEHTDRRIPPPTREQPFPPAEAMARLRQLESLRDQASALGAKIRVLVRPARQAPVRRVLDLPSSPMGISGRAVSFGGPSVAAGRRAPWASRSTGPATAARYGGRVERRAVLHSRSDPERTHRRCSGRWPTRRAIGSTRYEAGGPGGGSARSVRRPTYQETLCSIFRRQPQRAGEAGPAPIRIPRRSPSSPGAGASGRRGQ
jgi:hypothetical protein